MSGSGSGQFEISAPDSYTPGEPLLITVRMDEEGTDRQGFELTVLRDSDNQHVGTLDLGGSSAIEFADDNPQYVTHSTPGTQWEVTWIPPAAAVGPVTVYAAGASNPFAFPIYTSSRTISPVEVNSPPSAVADEATTDEDTPVVIDALNNDGDPDPGDQLQITAVSSPTPEGGTVTIRQDGRLRYSPAQDFNGTDSFSYSISDGNGGTAQAAVTVTVNPVNDAPPTTAITLPADGATVVIGGEEGEAPRAPATPFVVSWNEVEDVDGDPVNYTWQLASTEAFTSPLINQNVGDATRYETDFGTLATLLTNEGVSLFGSAALFHRVQASDGQRSTASAAAHVTLTRGTITSSEAARALPAHFMLEQNYPNPFNPATRIRFALPEPGTVRLAVFDLLGVEVAVLVNQPMKPGWHEVVFDAKGAASGVYFYVLEVGRFRGVKQMLLLK